MSVDKKSQVDRLVRELAEIISRVSDQEAAELLGDGIVDELLRAIAEPKKNKDQTIYDYLLANRHRLTLVALIRHAITHNYSLKGVVNGVDCFVSPAHYQWYDNGVIFLQGINRFEGAIGLYQGGQVKFAIAARDIKPGDSLGPGDLEFIDVAEAQDRAREKSLPARFSDLEAAIAELEFLLTQGVDEESRYQDYLERHPWVIGAAYREVQSHRVLDDRNIPDFTAVRVRDDARDILEIKSPFLPVFREDCQFRAEFNNAWNQVEKYLDLTRREADYLYRQKGLRFENPRCYLLCGFNLTPDQIAELRRKERMNPVVTILTYNDLLAIAKSTVVFIRNLKEMDKEAS